MDPLACIADTKLDKDQERVDSRQDGEGEYEAGQAFLMHFSSGARCPHCNSALPRRLGFQSAEPICPYCEQPVPKPLFDTNQRQANRRLAIGLLVLMLGLAFLSLIVALQTARYRRSHDPRELLGYLPADTNAVAVIHVQSALQEPAGRVLLTASPANPFPLDGWLRHWAGLSLEDCDTIALGWRAPQHATSRLTLIIQTRRAIQAPFMKRLAADTDAQIRHDKSLYRVRTLQGGTVTLWPAAETVLICSRTPEDFDQVPDDPGPGIDQLSAPLQQLIRERIGPQPHVWFAFADPQLQKSDFLSGVLPPGSAAQRWMTQLDAAAGWLRFADLLELHAVLSFRNEQGASRFRNALPALQQAGQRALRVVTVDLTASPNQVQQAFREWLAPIQLVSAWFTVG